MMTSVDRTVLWRAALVQTMAVAVVAISLGVALDKGFFQDWGWLAGPAAWVACALFTARILHLPWAPVLAGAALAGLPALVFVPLGVHWPGTVLGVGIFAWWCARVAGDRGPQARAI